MTPRLLISVVVALVVSTPAYAQRGNWWGSMGNPTWGPGREIARVAPLHTGGNAPMLSPPPGVDPGLRTGTTFPNAGGFFSGLSASELAFLGSTSTSGAAFWTNTLWTVAGITLPGLGPGYDTPGCAACHSFPTLGGTSAPTNYEYTTSPTYNGANTNTIPAFVTQHGPIVIPWNTTFQGTMPIYSVQGMTDASTCTFAQPNWTALLAQSPQIIYFTSPMPWYGLGLVEATPAANIVADQTVIPGGASWTFAGLGITTGNFQQDIGGLNTVGRKGATSSVEEFAGIAEAVEVGVTSGLYPRKAEHGSSACDALYNLPEDRVQLARRAPNSSSVAADYSSMQVLTSTFARSLAPATPVTSGGYTTCGPTNTSGTCVSPVTTVAQSDVTAGQTAFINVGCVACHTQSHTTGYSSITGTSQVTYSPWSDYAIHNMGTGLTNGITFGAAGPQDWRTPALWGTGIRLFFMHDGRCGPASSPDPLNCAITAHDSLGSEASAVEDAFYSLSTTAQQQILDFLRSL